MKTRKEMSISLRKWGGTAFMAIAAALTASGGYGDLPDTFDASTGYVTLNSSDGTGAGNQSFFLAKNWRDGRPPHSDADYYVQAGRWLGTPHVDSDVTAQQEKDPAGYLTFQGRTLVIAGYIWHLNGTYEFTFPDLHMLPGAYIHYTALKPSLNGMMTVYGTSANPVRVNFSMGTGYSILMGMKLKGDSESYLATDWGTGTPHWLKLTGDLSDYCGTLRVGCGTSTSSDNVGFWILQGLLGGTVELPRAKASLVVGSESGLTVGGLRVTSADTRLFIDGTKLSAASPRLTITNSLEMSHFAYVMMNGITGSSTSTSLPGIGGFSEPTAPGELKLVRLTPEAVANGGWTDARLSEKFSPPAAGFQQSVFIWRDDADGGKTLWLVTCVKHSAEVSDGTTNSSIINEKNGDKYNWSSETCPATDPNAANLNWMSAGIALPESTGVYHFPGKALILTSWANAFRLSEGFWCDDMVWRNSGLNTASVGTMDSPVRWDENGSRYCFYKLQGKIRVPTGHWNTLQSYGARCVIRVESEVSGGGNLKLQTIKTSGNFANHCGYHEFTALNTNFMGKVKVTTETATSGAGYTTPNWIEHVRLFVSDERNLGGARDLFAWDALYLDQYSDIYPLNNVTFTDGWNRGIAIGNIGRMNVPSNLTMSIWRPLNVNGNLVKEGNGTLALGGTLTFGGSEQSATPTVGANLLTVAGGRIKPLAKNAFDGLAITFTNNAALCVDGTPADAALRQYGLVNTKEATAPVSLAANQPKLPVSVDFGDATEPPAEEWTVGLVTLETAKAEALRSKMVLKRSPFAGWRGELDVVSNGDGTSTVVVNYKYTGIVLIVL